MSKYRPLVIAHRGASRFRPENTMPAFHMAFEECKADMVELDVQPSKDGIPVVFHDETLERTTNGQGRVSNQTWDALKKLNAGYYFDPEAKNEFSFRGRKIRISQLEEIFDSFPQKSLAVEIKDRSAEHLKSVIALAEKYHMLSNCIIGSRHDSIFRKLRKGFPDLRVFLSQRQALKLLAEFVFFRRKKPEKASGLIASLPLTSPLFNFNSKSWIDFLHQKEIQVFYWTVNDPPVMKDLRDKGADGIISDDPGLLRQTLEKAN